MAVNYLTLRSTISYATDGSQAPINSLMAVSSVGVTTWTNRIAISTLTASTITASTVSFSTMTASTIITAGSTITLGQNASVPNRYVQIGTDAVDTVYFDFHSKDSTLSDYSTRIISLGGATTGTGGLNMYASTIGLMGTAGVGIGTTVPSSNFQVASGLTTDLGGALKTGLLDTGYTAANAAAAVYNGTLSGSGPYLFTLTASSGNTYGNIPLGLTMPAGTSIIVTIIASSTSVPSSWGFATSSVVPAYVFVTALTGTLQTFTATINVQQPTSILGVWMSGAVGNNITFTSFTVRYTSSGPTAMLGNVGIGTTMPTTANFQILKGQTVDLGGALQTAWQTAWTDYSTSSLTLGYNSASYTYVSTTGTYTVYNAGTDGVILPAFGVVAGSPYTLQITLSTNGTQSPNSFTIRDRSNGTALTSVIINSITLPYVLQFTAPASGQIDFYISVGVSKILYITAFKLLRMDAMNVGIGVTNPTSALQVASGLTTDLGGGLKTSYTDTGLTAASLVANINGTRTGPSGSTYTFTTSGTNGSLTASVANIPSGSYVTMSITCNITAGSGLAAFFNGTNSYVTPTLTSSMQSFTFQFVAGTQLLCTIVSATGTVFNWNAFSVQRIDTLATGNVGIGVTNPGYLLTAQTASGWGIVQQQQASGPQVGFYTGSGVAYIGTITNHDLYFCTNNSGPQITIQKATGFVGIGLTTPLYPLHVSGSGTQSVTGGYFFASGTPITTWSTSSQAISIYATSSILSQGNFLASSDIRIKKNIKPVIDSLSKINALEYVQYDKIDYKEKGCDIGVVAHNVQTVLPRAVSKMTKIIPNIYERATHVLESEYVRIIVSCSSSDIKENGKVRLIIVKTGQDTETEYDTTIHHLMGESFDVTPWDNYSPDDKVFVYGTEVDDFLSVDKDQIGMLAAAGVKELHPLVIQQAKKILSLEVQLSAQTSVITSLEARLAALEAK